MWASPPSFRPLPAPPFSPLRRLAKILVSGVVIPLIIYAYQFKNTMSRYQLLVLYTVHNYFSLELLLAAVHTMIHGMLGMEMEPQVDRPYLASSLQDFWGQRWNLMVLVVLRPSMYHLVRMCLGDAAGILAVFLVIGLMHEVIYYIMWWPLSSKVTTLFLLHEARTAAGMWCAWHVEWWCLPQEGTMPLTLVFMAVMGFWLFVLAMIKGMVAVME